MNKTNLDRNRVRELIEEEGRTQKWVAKQCGITDKYLSQILTGTRSPSLPVIKLLAAVLKTEESALVIPKAS
jgi:transcriptional regulator with XRE-family HTH domain